MSNEAEFIEILERNKALIMKIVLAYTQSREEREDLFSDIVLEMWKAYPKFRGESRLSTWLYRVALNTSMNYSRKKKKDDMLIYTDTIFEEYGQRKDEIPLTENIELLYQHIGSLNDINKAIILLFLDGNSYDEISGIVGISSSNVGTRIGRIREIDFTQAIADVKEKVTRLKMFKLKITKLRFMISPVAIAGIFLMAFHKDGNWNRPEVFVMIALILTVMILKILSTFRNIKTEFGRLENSLQELDMLKEF